MSGVILLVLRIAMTVALYAMLGWILLLMWQTLKQEASFLSRRRVPPLALELQASKTPAEVFRFNQGNVIVGRDPDCECVLADTTISARHVRFSYHHNQWWVEDLGSRNGTILNGDPLTTATIVLNGDTIKCGQTVLKIIIEEETSAERPISDTEVLP